MYGNTPRTTEQLVVRLREATANITGTTIMNWFRKCGYVIPGRPEPVRAPDPNRGVEDRCSLPREATFDPREHVACFNEAGKLKREKKTGHKRWSHFEEADEDEDLENLSVTRRSGVLPRKRQVTAPEDCAPPDEKVRAWTGVSGEQPELKIKPNEDLWQPWDDFSTIEKITDERKSSTGATEYRIRWRNGAPSQWVPATRFEGSEFVADWRARNKRREELKRIARNRHGTEPASGPRGGQKRRSGRRGCDISVEECEHSLLHRAGLSDHRRWYLSSAVVRCSVSFRCMDRTTRKEIDRRKSGTVYRGHQKHTYLT